MKKVLFVSDGKNLPKGTFEFIKLLNETERILLTSVFYLSVDGRILIPTAIYPDFGLMAGMVEDESENVSNTVKLFKEDCLKNGIEYRLHDEGKLWNLNEVAKESRFSDLLVISEELFFSSCGPKQPNHFLRQVLHCAECPVIAIPEDFSGIQKVLVAYNGEADSLFALRSFVMLFPALSNLETDVVFVEEYENENIPNLEYLEEYAARHLTNLNIKKLHFDSSEYLVNAMGYNKNCLLIAGAFNRSNLSNLFKGSFVEKIIKEHRLPVFIAHK
jgi:nucleotide-binding universal stress UspA family protein